MAEIIDKVVVRRQWNDYRQGTVRFEDLEEPHWSQYSGGVYTRANQPYIHAFVSCDAIFEGEVAHTCLHGKGPHRIKVCIVRKDNDPAIYAKILAQVKRPKPHSLLY